MSMLGGRVSCNCVFLGEGSVRFLHPQAWIYITIASPVNSGLWCHWCVSSSSKESKKIQFQDTTLRVAWGCVTFLSQDTGSNMSCRRVKARIGTTCTTLSFHTPARSLDFCSKYHIISTFWYFHPRLYLAQLIIVATNWTMFQEAFDHLAFLKAPIRSTKLPYHVYPIHLIRHPQTNSRPPVQVQFLGGYRA